MSDYASEPISEMKMIAAAPEVKLLAAKNEPADVEINPYGFPAFAAHLEDLQKEVMLSHALSHAMSLMFPPRLGRSPFDIVAECDTVSQDAAGKAAASIAKQMIEQTPIHIPTDAPQPHERPEYTVVKLGAMTLAPKVERVQRIQEMYKAGIVALADYKTRLALIASFSPGPSLVSDPWMPDPLESSEDSTPEPVETAESLTDALIQDRPAFAPRRAHLLYRFREAIAQDRREPLGDRILDMDDPSYPTSRVEGLCRHLRYLPEVRAAVYGLTRLEITRREIVRMWSPCGYYYLWTVEACCYAIQYGRRCFIETDTASSRPAARRQLQAAVKGIKDEYKEARAIFDGDW